ncbi:hypothetical protein B0J18DRAFT_480991 [Chaetomium sp. MPI-SDFR-AT-0129]|nr:hypothetical protein B0J18DRAFT_480991 [Chaetomium sp. MPI-SDFR-AT-0129]
MATPAMRSLTRLRASHPPPTFLSRRAETSSRPVTLTLTLALTRNYHQTPTRRPTSLPSSSTKLTLHHHHVHHQQTRPFSLYPLIETTLSLSHTALTTLHTATGTPWFLTIPLFSLAVSLLTRLPAIIYSRRTHQRLQRIQPLANAWRARVRHDLQGELRRQPDNPTATAAGSDGQRGRGRGQQLTPKSFYNHARAAQSKLYRRWGVHTWRETGMRVAAVPFWLVGIEWIRRICGGPRGVVGTFLFGRGEGVETVVTEAFTGGGSGGSGTTGTGTGTGEMMLSGTGPAGGNEVMATTAGGWVDDAVAAASTSAADIQQAVAASSSSSGYAADPTLMTGGCLWFPDLTAADPLHILPLALSVVFVLNIMPNTMSGIRLLFGARDPQNPGTSDAAVLDPAMKWRLRLQRSLLMVGIAVGPLTMDLPCALHLYWITSSLSGNLQAQVISTLMPLPKTVPPAKMQEPIFISPTRESVAFEEERERQWAQEKRNRQ